MTYEETTRSSPTSDQIIPFLALAGSLPELAAKIYIIPDTTNATVTIVPIKNVAERMMSWAKSPTDVASPGFLTLFLMPRVSYTLNLHCPLMSWSPQHVMPITVSHVSGLFIFFAASAKASHAAFEAFWAVVSEVEIHAAHSRCELPAKFGWSFICSHTQHLVSHSHFELSKHVSANEKFVLMKIANNNRLIIFFMRFCLCKIHITVFILILLDFANLTMLCDKMIKTHCVRDKMIKYWKILV